MIKKISAKKIRRALIVSPYLDHLGGGERYMLTIASVLGKLGMQVFFAWDNTAEITRLAGMLGITLPDLRLDAPVKNLYFSRNPLLMYRATRAYDLVVYLSDGSLPLLGGRRNIVHMQVPFHDVGGKSWKNKIKQRFISRVIVNSRFTKNIIDREYGIKSEVVYPPVNLPLGGGEKSKIILSVGRFEPSLNAKKQDVLIDAFSEVSPRLPGWNLVLAGAGASDAWIVELKKRAGNLPVTFAVDASYEDLCRYYREAAIYWHAAGYGIDAAKNPELVEHFGITTVEAIASGCLPQVYPSGGQPEIVTDPGFHWQTVQELAEHTVAMATNPGEFEEARRSLTISAYSETEFENNIQSICLD